MIDAWTLFNLVLAFLCGAYVIWDFTSFAAQYLAEQDDINDGE